MRPTRTSREGPVTPTAPEDPWRIFTEGGLTMGLQPCTVCRKGYRGRSQHAYPALIGGGDKISKKHSVCPDCFDHLHEFATSQMTLTAVAMALVQADTRELCAACDKPLDEFTVAAFLTLYGRQDPREDYYCEAHPSCRESLAAMLGLWDQPGLFRGP